MRFYTKAECEQWVSDRNRRLPDADGSAHNLRLPYPIKPGRFFWAAHWIASSLPYRMPCLLWITEWGIWENTESSHLYYRLRQSYGDNRLLWEAPGHLFLGYETEELTSFLVVAMLNGWGGHIVTEANYLNAFFSHDEYIEFHAENADNLDPVRTELLKAE